MRQKQPISNEREWELNCVCLSPMFCRGLLQSSFCGLLVQGRVSKVARGEGEDVAVRLQACPPMLAEDSCQQLYWLPAPDMEDLCVGYKADFCGSHFRTV